ncbi:MAG: PspA/IM30 family protein, partial [Microterricola sp.]
MSNASRIRNILRSKTSRGLDKVEDPRELLDNSYDQMVRMLQQVRQGLAEVATAKKRIELQGQEMGDRHSRLGRQAQEAMDQGR